ncbi:MAG: helix-turn-helix domain containing protein [Acidimicrobiales bacterium]|nr:helix-turn-helix domain containing protein [Acidimicrobiales bacterium]
MAVNGSLSPEQVVSAARRLITAGGLDAFSMRKLAAVLDVNPMTIYLRFESKDVLLQAVAQASLTGLRLPPPSGSWIDQVVDLAAAIKDHLVADRAMLRVHSDPARLSAGVLGAVDRGLGLMAEVGYEGAHAVESFRQLFWSAVGAALVDGTFDSLPGSRSDLTEALAAVDDHPHIHDHATHFGPVDANRLFRSTARSLAVGLAAAAPMEIPS